MLEFKCTKCDNVFSEFGVYSYNERFKVGRWYAKCPNCWNPCSIQSSN